MESLSLCLKPVRGARGNNLNVWLCPLEFGGHNVKSQKATKMDDHPQNVSRPRMCEFPAGLGKGAGLAWPERDPIQEEPHLEEEMILTEKGMCMVI